MKSAMNHIFFLVSALMMLAGSIANAYEADGYKRFPRDFWEFQLNSRFFRTEANHTTGGGAFENLPGSNYFQQGDFDFKARFVVDKDFAYFVGAGLALAESKDLVATRSNSNFRDLSAGLEYLFYSDWIDVIPEVSLVIPLETYSPSTDSVMITEGVFEVKSKVTLQKSYKKFNGFTSFGFTFRGDQRSYLLPYGVGLEWKLPRARIGAELMGYLSLTDDQDTRLRSQREAVSDRVNGGSLYHYAVNPSLMEAVGYYKFRLGQTWVAHVGGGFTITGSSSASGFQAFAGLRYSFDTSKWYQPEEAPEPIPESMPTGQSKMYLQKSTEPVSSEKDVKAFQEQYDDQVDQKIFRQTSPTLAAPPKSQSDAEMKVQLRKDSQKSKKKKARPEDGL